MTRLRYGLVLVLAAALTGCGGSSSSSLEPAAPAAPVAPSACTSVSGEAAVGGTAVSGPDGCTGLGDEQDLEVADPGLAGERLGQGSSGKLCGSDSVAPVGDEADLDVEVGSESSDC